MATCWPSRRAFADRAAAACACSRRSGNACWRSAIRQSPLPAPKQLAAAPKINGDRLEDWKLEPTAPDWAGGLRSDVEARRGRRYTRLKEFLDEKALGYATQRATGRTGTRPRTCHRTCASAKSARGRSGTPRALPLRGTPKIASDIEKFLSELGWREFCRHLLFDHPDMHRSNLQSSFDAFPWASDDAALRAWQKGRTGYPIVDAGMRELWRTGVMHNRVRMIVASFLVKHLLIDWREGEAWFWDTLVDADPGNNPANWQWVAGSGADAAPYFRIFNPILQGEKFDPQRRLCAALGGRDRQAAEQPDPQALDGDAARARKRRRHAGQDLSAADRRSQGCARARAGGAMRRRKVTRHSGHAS